MLRRGFWVESFSIYRCVFGGLNKGFVTDDISPKIKIAV